MNTTPANEWREVLKAIGYSNINEGVIEEIIKKELADQAIDIVGKTNGM